MRISGTNVPGEGGQGEGLKRCGHLQPIAAVVERAILIYNILEREMDDNASVEIKKRDGSTISIPYALLQP